MAVGMLPAGEGVTEESYKQLTEAMFGSYPMRQDQSPEGLLVHTAGPGDQGWYIYDIWESPEHFQRFAEEKLRPAMSPRERAAARNRDRSSSRSNPGERTGPLAE